MLGSRGEGSASGTDDEEGSDRDGDAGAPRGWTSPVDSSDSGGEDDSDVGDADVDLLDSSDDEGVPEARGRDGRKQVGAAPAGVKRSMAPRAEPGHAGMAVKRPRFQSRAEAAAAAELVGLSVAEQEALALRMLTNRSR